MSVLTFTDFMASGGLFGASEEKIDMSEVLAAVLFENRQLLGMLKWGPPAENIVYKHLEDSVNPPTILGTWTGGTTFTPSTTYTQADVYRLLRHSAASGALGLTLQVDVDDGQGITIRRTVDTGVPLAGDTNWTIIGGTTAAVSSDAKFYISLPKADEVDASVDTSKARTVREGAVRVFERAIELAETRQHITMYAIPDELKHQTKLRTIEIGNELAQAIIREWIDASSGLAAGISAAAGTRTFPGIIQQLVDPNLDNAVGTWDDGTGTVAPLNVDVAGASMITKAILNARVQEIFDAGGIDAPGYDGAIVCSPLQARQIATFDETLRRSTLDYRKAGYTVDTFVSDLGYSFPIIVERFWPNTMVGILDMSRIEMRGLQGDDWHLEKMAKTGRTDKWQLSGQFGVSVKNIDTCQSLIFKLSTS